MKVFHCDHCRHLLFFENVSCISCGHTLAFLPDLMVVGSLDPAADGLWKSPIPRAKGRTYRLCANYTGQNICNWAIPSTEAGAFCESCRLTCEVRDLHRPGFREAWYKIEVAKRRLVYSLKSHRLPLNSPTARIEDGLRFEFLADPADPSAPRVMTGHANGLITLNVAEADDAERERRRVQMREPYRTLLGHFRHESGHYYWDRLIRETDRLAGFRKLFGNEADYGQALERHHAQGAPPDWQSRFVSAYASAHPWEDWAETWAHYLHMTDLLETAAGSGLSLRPRRKGEPVLTAVPDPLDDIPEPFDDLLDSWYPLTYLLNNLNRGMGLPDGYPFVLSVPAVEKLRFIHETISNGGHGPAHKLNVQ